MKKAFILISILVVAVFVFGIACTQKEKAKEQTKEAGKSGEALFQQHCSPCHADGGNNVNPQKTLHKKDREANGVKTASDIVGKMRNPGPGMTKFDEKTVSDNDANEIAGYVLKTF
jgi:cytochrome c6